MERQLFTLLYEWLVAVGAAHERGKKQFSNVIIVAVLFWAGLHDRPILWACQEINWPADRQWVLQLPSPATMSRRLQTYSVHLLLHQLASFLRDMFPHHMLKIVDAKPLVVGPTSKDRDARRGYAAGLFAKGYKVCVILDACGVVDAWRLEPMNVGESQAATQLVLRMPGNGYIVADALYDAGPFYQAAGEAGWQVIAQPKFPEAKRRQVPNMSPFRMRGLELASNPLACSGQATSFGQDLLELRDIIERRFGYFTNFGGGLAPLPNWVRRPHRVAMWVQVKFIIAMARDLRNHKHLAA